MARKSFVFLIVGTMVLFLCSISSADVPHMINYQGKLTTASGGCLNDTVQMTFSIYPDTLGSPADWSETQTQVVVKEGIFNVLLGAVDTIPRAVFDGSVKYLGVQVEADPEMRPLKPMVSVAYAYRAAGVDGGGGGGGWVDDGTVIRLETETDSVGIGTTTPAGKLHVESSGLYSGYFTSDFVSNQTHVIHAECTGAAPGVAVYGESTPSDGSGRGGYFVGGSSGLLGKVEPTGSETYCGVIGSVSNLGGSSGSNHGVHALAAAGGTNYGVYALGYGDGSEETCGTYSFATNSSTGDAYGGYFCTTDNGTGTHYGIYAESRSEATGRNYGTYSYANNQTTGDCYAGYFVADDESTGVDTHTGLRADGQANSASTTYGVCGRAENVGSGTVRGGYFAASSTGTGTHYGVEGNELAGGGGAAVYASGDFAGSGAKYAVVKTGRGHRLLSCMESPEIWFEDFGEGKLVNGKAHIELDALFLETVTINADHPMKVFVQVDDENCKGTAVKRGTTGFDVIELQQGTSNTSFSYRIVAKRKGYENERMRETDVGYDDPTLYPELQAEIDKTYREERQQQLLQREKHRQEDERRKEEQRQMEEELLRQEGTDRR